MIDIFQWLIDITRGNRLGGIRSPQWKQVRKQFLKDNPFCEVCGKKGTILEALEVHHCVPFSVDKSLELATDNLITLCSEDHFIFGHLKFWKSFNENIKEDAKIWKEKINPKVVK